MYLSDIYSYFFIIYSDVIRSATTTATTATTTATTATATATDTTANTTTNTNTTTATTTATTAATSAHIENDKRPISSKPTNESVSTPVVVDDKCAHLAVHDIEYSHKHPEIISSLSGKSVMSFQQSYKTRTDDMKNQFFYSSDIVPSKLSQFDVDKEI
jgi:hypothetical protein